MERDTLYSCIGLSSTQSIMVQFDGTGIEWKFQFNSSLGEICYKTKVFLNNFGQTKTPIFYPYSMHLEQENCWFQFLYAASNWIVWDSEVTSNNRRTHRKLRTERTAHLIEHKEQCRPITIEQHQENKITIVSRGRYHYEREEDMDRSPMMCQLFSKSWEGDDWLWLLYCRSYCETTGCSLVIAVQWCFLWSVDVMLHLKSNVTKVGSK